MKIKTQETFAASEAFTDRLEVPAVGGEGAESEFDERSSLEMLHGVYQVRHFPPAVAPEEKKLLWLLLFKHMHEMTDLMLALLLHERNVVDVTCRTGISTAASSRNWWPQA